MLALPRHDFANCSVLPGPAGLLYLLRAKAGRSYLLEKDLSNRKTRTIAVLSILHLHPALAYNAGQVYILGGTDESEGKVYKDCLQVENRLGGIERLPDLIYARGKAASVWHQQHLYIIGGYEEVWRNGQAKYRLSTTIEKLNPGNWVLISLRLPVPLAAPCPSLLHNRLFLLGNFHTGGLTSGSQSNTAIYELSLVSSRGRKVGEARYTLEEGMPVQGEATRLGFLFQGRRSASDQVVTMQVQWTVWTVRRTLLLARLKLQRLALF